MLIRSCPLPLALVFVFVSSWLQPHSSAQEVKIVDDGQKATVTIDGLLFTQYHYAGFAKPILFPVLGPGQNPMTRSYPIVKGVDNEASDHPHHKSIWYTHDEVGGIRFWTENAEGRRAEDIGTQVQTKLTIKDNQIVSENDWRDGTGKTICSDRRQITFGLEGNARFIDYDLTWIASSDDFTIGDTKEGTMGIRTHPRLRLKADPKRGNHTAGGQSVNSEGVTGKSMWGKRAAWVDYWGTIDEDVVGVAIFDHADNPRHPTWWHARDYGLVAANPFGVNHFENKPDGTGDMTLKSGDTMTFRYRFLFHPGDAKAADVKGAYQRYVQQ